jgi:DNA-binding FadR family transcriptional regulator
MATVYQDVLDRLGPRIVEGLRPRDEWDSYNPAVVRWRLAGAGRGVHLHELSQLRSVVEPAAAGSMSSPE